MLQIVSSFYLGLLIKTFDLKEISLRQRLSLKQRPFYYSTSDLSSYPVGRARWIIWFFFNFLQISVVLDTLPQDDGVLHQGEEHEHHAGQ